MTTDDLRRRVRLLTARYLREYPQDAELPDDVLHRAAAETIIAHRRRDVPAAFYEAFGDAP